MMFLCRVGIIGEPMELFEPETLTLKNVDIEDDGDSRDTGSIVAVKTATRFSLSFKHIDYV